MDRPRPPGRRTTIQEHQISHARTPEDAPPSTSSASLAGPAAPTGPAAPAAPSARSKWILLAVVALAQLMVVLDGTIVNIALPAAQRDLGMTDADRTWVVTVYALAFGSLLLLGGRIADYWGRKRSFLLGMVGFAAASAIGGFAVSSETLLIARGLQGVFAALLAPAALALLSVTFPSGPDRVKAFAVYGTIAGSGAAVGLLLGGVLTEYLSWHWCLLVNVPIAIVAIVAGIPLVKESRADGDRSYDVPGALLVTLGLASIVYGFSRAENGWTQPDTIGFLALGVGIMVAFVWWESRARNPLLPPRVVADRTRGGAYLTSVMVGAALLGGLLYLTLHFQIVLGMSPLISGLASLPMAATIMLTAPQVARLLPKVGPRVLMTIGPLLAAAGCCGSAGSRSTARTSCRCCPARSSSASGSRSCSCPCRTSRSPASSRGTRASRVRRSQARSRSADPSARPSSRPCSPPPSPRRRPTGCRTRCSSRWTATTWCSWPRRSAWPAPRSSPGRWCASRSSASARARRPRP
ncbi:putative MFS-type transporter EfpA [Clavibacter michiganensis subsp. michiganensis]|uniref:Putative MFS-type transporter EfpA n=1 Tax=Clavibacter michiganensis subsp. michiganensis TaxID=33013 RepID=A0A251XFA0_CLAMM|nr:putative MFS-type transporter EfpA [Clavibacter michiganensis subsp. michiganensis]OUE00931.1 putative MFS-type transporter EfpA [Clavibacter michiganensis subsp. michiganensis]